MLTAEKNAIFQADSGYAEATTHTTMFSQQEPKSFASRVFGDVGVELVPTLFSSPSGIRYTQGVPCPKTSLSNLGPVPP